MFRILSFLFAILLFLPIAQAKDWTVYRGKLEGAGIVVMELSPTSEAGQYEGRYFYPRYGIDIFLSGTLDEFREENPPLNDPNVELESGYSTGYWKGRIEGDHYRGHWSRTGRDTEKKLKFDLVRVSTYSVPNAGLRFEQMPENFLNHAHIDSTKTPYTYLKLNGYAVPVGPAIGDETLAYQMWADPRSVFEYPRLVRHPNPEIMKRVNALLEQRHWQLTTTALKCRRLSAGKDAGGYEHEHVEVAYLSPLLMSVVESGRTQGVHGFDCNTELMRDSHFYPYTLDLRRGAFLNWRHLINLSTFTITFDAGGHDVLHPELFDLLYRKLEASGLKAYSCRALFDVDSFGLHVVKQDRLAISASGFSEYNEGCLGIQFEVPLSELAPLLKPAAHPYFFTEH